MGTFNTECGPSITMARCNAGHFKSFRFGFMIWLLTDI